jgi:DNA primase
MREHLNVSVHQTFGKHLQLIQVGKRYKALCPFHREKNPSFYIDPDTNLWYCFGCGAGGDVVKFLMKINNWSRGEAIAHLYSLMGKSPPLTFKSHGLLAVYEEAAKFYHAVLVETPAGKDGIRYLLEDRGLTKETIDLFNIGYAPPYQTALFEHMQSRFDIDTLRDSGLFTDDGAGGLRDLMHNRVTIPLADTHGKPNGFVGRAVAMNEPVKYLTIRESGSAVPFNFHRAMPHFKDGIVITEGAFDAITLWQNGLRGAIALLGSSQKIAGQCVSAMKEFKCFIAFDGDEAGVNGVLKVTSHLAAGNIIPRVGTLPPGHDPDSYVRSNGIERFHEILNDADELPLWLAKRFNIREKPDELRRVFDALINYDEMTRHYCVRRISEHHGLPIDALWASLKQMEHGDARPQFVQPSRITPEHHIIALLVEHPSLRDVDAFKNIKPEYFQDEECKKAFVALTSDYEDENIDSVAHIALMLPKSFGNIDTVQTALDAFSLMILRRTMEQALKEDDIEYAQECKKVIDEIFKRRSQCA